MRLLNLDQLRTLVAVVDLGSLASAASALHLSQPAISLHLKELESRLNVRLLQRGRKGVSPTPAGAVLIERARELLSSALQAEDAVRQLQTGMKRRVRVGASAGILAHRMPTILKHIAARHPSLNIELSVVTTALAIDRLINGTLDLALISNPKRQSGLKFTKWCADPVVAYLPSEWVGPERVSPGWLHDKPLLMNEEGSALQHQTLQWFAKAGFAPRARIAMNNGEAIKSLVGAGYGAALLPLESASKARPAGVVVRELKPAMVRQTFIVHRSTAPLADSLQDVIKLLVAEATTKSTARPPK